MLTTGTILDRFRMPPCAILLGWHLLDHDAARGWVRVGFEGKPEFANPSGSIQGGILSAMLDDTMGPCVLLMSEGKLYTSSIDMHVSFLARALPGPLVGEAHVQKLGTTIAFIDACLMDASGQLLARASTAARLIETARVIGESPADIRP
jgi:uncharacterized protein (TIGR00369 family)